MIDIENSSESELADVIAKASRALEQKRERGKRDVIARMRELAASIGVELAIHDSNRRDQPTRTGSKVAVKYRDPANPDKAWSGRGVKPRWLTSYIDQGRSIEDFLV